MKIIVSGKNIEITNALKERAVKKVGKLNKFFNPETEAHITMSVQKNRHIIEVTIYFNGIVLRAEETSEDMYASIDRVIGALERQIRRNKTRLEKKLHEEAFNTDKPDTDNEVEEEEEFRVVRTKKFAFKPMTVEEAILQMNLLGHAFFMFSNAENNSVNVVYKRKSGDYGLIEPEF